MVSVRTLETRVLIDQTKPVALSENLIIQFPQKREIITNKERQYKDLERAGIDENFEGYPVKIAEHVKDLPDSPENIEKAKVMFSAIIEIAAVNQMIKFIKKEQNPYLKILKETNTIVIRESEDSMQSERENDQLIASMMKLTLNERAAKGPRTKELLGKLELLNVDIDSLIDEDTGFLHPNKVFRALHPDLAKFSDLEATAMALKMTYEWDKSDGVAKLFLRNSWNAIAVRERLELVTQIMQDHVLETIKQKTIDNDPSKVKIVSLASGAAMGVYNLICNVDPEFKKLATILLDIDPRAVDESRKTAEEKGIHGMDKKLVEFKLADESNPSRELKTYLLELKFIAESIKDPDLKPLCLPLAALRNNGSEIKQKLGLNQDATGTDIIRALEDRLSLQFDYNKEQMNGTVTEDESKFIVGNVFNAKQMVKPGEADIVEFTGLADYLTSKQIVTLIKDSMVMLKEGGLLEFAIIRHNPEEKFLHEAVDWSTMYYKNQEEIANYLKAAGIHPEDATIYIIPSGIYNVVKIIKRTRSTEAIELPQQIMAEA